MRISVVYDSTGPPSRDLGKGSWDKGLGLKCYDLV